MPTAGHCIPLSQSCITHACNVLIPICYVPPAFSMTSVFTPKLFPSSFLIFRFSKSTSSMARISMRIGISISLVYNRSVAGWNSHSIQSCRGRSPDSRCVRRARCRRCCRSSVRSSSGQKSISSTPFRPHRRKRNRWRSSARRPRGIHCERRWSSCRTLLHDRRREEGRV